MKLAQALHANSASTHHVFVTTCRPSTDVHFMDAFPGPGKAYTAKEQAEMLFRITGREPKFFSVPVKLMDIIIGAMELIGKVIPPVGVRWCRPAA